MSNAEATTRVCLLVTGSRTIADDSFAALWAHAILWQVLASLPRGSHVLVGDARGPDAWACQHAKSLRLGHSVFGLDGSVRVWRPDAAEVRMAWGEPRGSEATACAQTLAGKKWPLVRNEAMARKAAESATRGWSPRALALRDAASRTRGTAHTVSCCLRGGVPVDERVWSVGRRGDPRTPTELMPDGEEESTSWGG